MGKWGNFGCDRWQEALNAFLDGEAPPSEQERIFAHLQTCPSCRASYQRLKALKRRLRRTNWGALWAKAIQANWRLRRWTVAGVIGVSLFSVGITATLIRHFWRPPSMTPFTAAALYHHHLHAPLEIPVNTNCPIGMECLLEKTVHVSFIPFPSPLKGKVIQVGICQCLKRPIAVYYLSVNDIPIFLLHFNTDILPIHWVQGMTKVSFKGETLYCFLVSDIHVLFWEREKMGFALAFPLGALNPFIVLECLGLP